MNKIIDVIKKSSVEDLRLQLSAPIAWRAKIESDYPLIEIALETAALAENDGTQKARLILSHWAKNYTGYVPTGEYFFLVKPLEVECLTWNWDWEKDFSAEMLLHVESDYGSVFLYLVPLEDGKAFIVEQPHCDSLFDAKPLIRAIGHATNVEALPPKVLRRIIESCSTKRLVAFSAAGDFEQGHDLVADGYWGFAIEQVYGPRIHGYNATQQ